MNFRLKTSLNIVVSFVFVLVLAGNHAFSAPAVESSRTTTPTIDPNYAAQSAKQAGNKQAGAQMAAIAMAAVMAAMCNVPKGNIAPCILSALAAAQAGSLGGTKQGAYGSGQQFQASTEGGTNGTGSTAADVPSVGAAGNQASIDPSIRRELEKRGAMITPDGKAILLPDGKKVALDASAATEAGQKAAGLTDDQISGGKAALAEAQAQVAQKITTAGVGDLPGGGGGGLGGSGGGGGYGAGGGSGAAALRDRKKANVSGMSKNLGNDKIGVAADNIFEMITRRYKAKEATDTFLKN